MDIQATVTAVWSSVGMNKCKQSAQQCAPPPALPSSSAQPIKDYLIVSEGEAGAVFGTFRGTRSDMRHHVTELNASRRKGERLQGINAGGAGGRRALLAAAADSRDGAGVIGDGSSSGGVSPLLPQHHNDNNDQPRAPLTPNDVLALHRGRTARFTDAENCAGGYLNLRSGRLGAGDVPAIASAWRGCNRLGGVAAPATARRNEGRDGGGGGCTLDGGNPRFTQLGLTGNNLGPEGCEALVEEILRDGDVDGDVVDECGCECGCASAASSSAAIEAVYLSRNAVGPKGGAALGRLLRSSSCQLTRLGLNFNGLGDCGARPIGVSLALQQRQQLQQLRRRHLPRPVGGEGGDIAGGGGGVLSQRTISRRLRVLGMSGNGLTDATAKLLAFALTPQRQRERQPEEEEERAAGCPTEETPVTEEEAATTTFTATATTVPTIPTLERLFLGDNEITSDGASALATMLRTNSTLRRLGLADNRIGRIGATHLADAVAPSKSLEKVCLYGNPFLDLLPPSSCDGICFSSASNAAGGDGGVGGAAVAAANSNGNGTDLSYDPVLHERMKGIPTLNLASRT